MPIAPGPFTRRTKRVGVLAFVALAGLTFARTASADLPDAVGYWRPVSILPISGPVVPEGGLWVATSGGEVVAYSAVRSSHQASTLSLELADAVGESFTLVACPVVTPWEPPGDEGGEIGDAPGFDCSRFVTGIVSDGRLSFDLLPLLHADGFDVAIVPSPASPATFSVTFRAPDSLTLAGVSPPTPSSTPTTTASPPTTTLERTSVPTAFVPRPGRPLAVGPDPSAGDARRIAAPDPDLPGLKRPAVTRGRTEPLALLLGLAVLSSWAHRHRTVRAQSARHVLARGPLSVEPGGNVAVHS